MARRDFAKRAIGAVYSKAADTLYEPLVVRTAFPLFGGDLNEVVLEQGRSAVASSGTAPILDMPVGTAYFTIAMAAARDALVVGVDIAEGMVRRAMRAGRDANTDNLVAVRADAHRLPFADSSFGAILCTNGLQVIPGLEETVAELARVLAPQKTLYVSVVMLPVGALLPARASRRLPTMLKSRREIAACLERAGLTVTSTRTQRLALLIEAVKPPDAGL
ncbi:MAG: class I SAM-dependent methyltransferase [Actinomycetota bacterium]|nr:class I SAM-dependent methyltransferase [Actinomycetota bacterium]